MRIRPLFAFALVALSTPAVAQIRMPRPRVPNPLDRATQAATQAVTPARTPTFDETVIEMTDARLGALIRGLRAEQQQRPGLEAGYKKNADDRASFEVRPAVRTTASTILRAVSRTRGSTVPSTATPLRGGRPRNGSRRPATGGTTGRRRPSRTR